LAPLVLDCFTNAGHVNGCATSHVQKKPMKLLVKSVGRIVGVGS
jgi:hypothetical protein